MDRIPNSAPSNPATSWYQSINALPMTSMSRSTKVTILLLHFTYSDTMYRHDRVRHPHKQQFPRICITPKATSDKNKVTGPHGKVLLCTKTFRPMQNIITIYSIHSIFSLSHLTFLMSDLPTISCICYRPQPNLHQFCPLTSLQFYPP